VPERSAHPLDAQVGIIGAGPVGLTLAGRLAQRGVSVLLLEQHPRLTGEGSRALCMQRETLEIWARLGVGEQVAKRGVQWSIGRTYFRGRELFSVRLPGAGDEHFPPFVNINQTEVEALLLEHVQALRTVDLRWGHQLSAVAQDRDGVDLRARTDAGEGAEAHFRVRYVVGTDGAHSAVRRLLGMGFPGHSHDDLFLICDIRTRLPFPDERRFHFDPPWNPGRQVLIHPQPDHTWRIDWQVPLGTDVEAERVNGRLDRRIRAVIGADTAYELVWVTAYRFNQRVVDRYRVGRVLVAGDAAHVMSPFGARGLNSGAADAENLAWKLALVLADQAPPDLLETYHAERRAAALENLAVTDATMRFMVPRGPFRRALRNAILRGSTRWPRLRRLVNSGRLAQPFVYAASPLVDAPERPDPRLPLPGAVAPDARCGELRSGAEAGPPLTRLRELFGGQFVALLVHDNPEAAARAGVRAAGLAWPAPVSVAVLGPAMPLTGMTVLTDPAGAVRSAYGGAGPRAFLVRPDGHLAGTLALPRPEAVDGLSALVAQSIGA